MFLLPVMELSLKAAADQHHCGKNPRAVSDLKHLIGCAALRALRTTQDFPEYLLMKERDEDEKSSESVEASPKGESAVDLEEELLSRAFGQADCLSEHAAWVLLKKGKMRNGARAALYRFSSQVGAYQVTDVAPTRQNTSVLGRMGVIDLVCRLLTSAHPIVEGHRKDVTVADVARVVSEEGTLSAMERFLRRLNSGDFVQGSNVAKLSRGLDLPVDLLCFRHPAVYEDPAWERRESNGLAIDARKAIIVSFRVLNPREPNITKEIIEALRKAADIDYRYSGTGVATADAAAGRFLEKVESARREHRLEALFELLPALNEDGLAAWVGEYEDRVRIPLGEQTEAESFYDVQARRVLQGIIVVQKVNAPCPSQIVETSHFDRLGLTIEHFAQG